jgi:uncharacterized protein YndB with AHSA1/START domain
MSDTSDRIEREITIAAPVARVWELITQPEHVGRWFGDAGAQIDLRPGGQLMLKWEDFGTVYGRVERVEPMTLFSYHWAPFKAPGGKDPVAGNSTLIEFTLSETDEGTRLRVVESGFASLDVAAERQEELRQGNVKGWGVELGHLEELSRAKV